MAGAICCAAAGAGRATLAGASPAGAGEMRCTPNTVACMALAGVALGVRSDSASCVAWLTVCASSSSTLGITVAVKNDGDSSGEV